MPVSLIKYKDFLRNLLYLSLIMNAGINHSRTENYCIAFILFFFVLIPFVRLYTIPHTAYSSSPGTDDWDFYLRNALEIKNGGLLIPSFKDAYGYPGGFFYNYFVAACFTVFGTHVKLVYCIQSILLGCSVVLIFLAFRERMQTRIRYLFLVSLFVFALLDVSSNYSMKLLSENLAVFTISGFVYFLLKGISTGKTIHQLLAVLLLVVSVLTRPALQPYGVLFALLLMLYFFIYKRRERMKAFSLLIILLVGISALAIRNYIVCGKFIFLPAYGMNESFSQINQLSFSFLVKKVLFMFGYLSALAPEYRIRPHWILMWIGYITYVVLMIRSRKYNLSEVPLHLFILVFCGFTIFFVTVDSYGFRSFIPVTFVILPFSFIAVNNIWLKRRAGESKT